MEDREIVTLFFERSERALTELNRKYGALCTGIARNILQDPLDAEECVNDAYLGVWNTIPPQKPEALAAYVCRLVRNRAITRYHANTAAKRNSFYDAALDELGDSLACTDTVESALAAEQLPAVLDAFLDTLRAEERVLFVRRYWYADSLEEAAARLHISRGLAAVRLSRTRAKLRDHLKKEGYEL